MALRCISPYKAGKGEDAVAYQPGDLIDCTPARQAALLLDSPGSFEVVDTAPAYEPKAGPADVVVTKAEPAVVADAVTVKVEPAPEAPAKKKGKGK